MLITNKGIAEYLIDFQEVKNITCTSFSNIHWMHFLVISFHFSQCFLLNRKTVTVPTWNISDLVTL